jgi:integrase
LEKRFPGCSFQNEHKYLQALANFMFHNGYLTKKISFELGKSKAKAISPREVMPPEIIKAILESIDSMEHPSEEAEIRRQVLIRCGKSMGMREGEISKLKTKNVFEKDGTWFAKLEDTKTDEDRTIAVASDVLPWLLKAREAALKRKSKYIFINSRRPLMPVPVQTLDKDWHAVFAKAKAFDYVFHEFKHTAITNAVNAGFSVAHISKYYGTSAQVLIDTYFHITEFDTAEIAEVMNKAKRST